MRYKTGFTNGIGIIGKKTQHENGKTTRSDKDENSEETMLPGEQKSEQRRTIPEHNPSSADIIQDDMMKQEEKNEQNYEDQCYQRNRIQVKNQYCRKKIW